MNSHSGSPPTSFQPINQAMRQHPPKSVEPRDNHSNADHDASVKSVQPRVLHPQWTDDLQYQPAREGTISEQQPSGSEEAARPSIPDRDWKVISVLDKRRSQGFVEHLVQWAASEHPSSLIRESDDGKWTIGIAGVEYGIAERTMTGRESNIGEPLELVKWKPSWHFAWNLPKAAVARFEQQLGEVKTDPQEVLELSWWTWREYEGWYYPPEPPPHAGMTKSMSLEYLEPELDSDYVISFLEQMRHCVLAEGDDPSKPCKKTITAFLNMRIRQRLSFPPDLVGEGRTLFLNREEHFRALMVYAFEFARINQCRCCLAQPGPFAKCVTWMGDFAGACSNCVFKRQRTQCDYHFRNFHQRLPELVLLPGLGSPSSSTPSESSAIAFRSSVDLQEQYDPFTPASSQDNDPGNVTSPELPMEVPPETIPDDSQSQGTRLASIDAHTGSDALPEDTEPRGRKRQPVDDGDKRPAVKAEDDSIDEPIPKRQRQDSQDLLSPTLEHRYCDGSPNKPCSDPDVGAVPPLDNSVIVFSKHRFTRAGEATDDQVRFILSRSDCAANQQLHETWESLLIKKEERGEENRWPSKENYISHRRWHKLNELIRDHCPWPSHGDYTLRSLVSSAAAPTGVVDTVGGIAPPTRTVGTLGGVLAAVAVAVAAVDGVGVRSAAGSIEPGGLVGAAEVGIAAGIVSSCWPRASRAGNGSYMTCGGRAGAFCRSMGEGCQPGGSLWSSTLLGGFAPSPLRGVDGFTSPKSSCLVASLYIASLIDCLLVLQCPPNSRQGVQSTGTYVEPAALLAGGALQACRGGDGEVVRHAGARRALAGAAAAKRKGHLHLVVVGHGGDGVYDGVVKSMATGRNGINQQM
ncbi:hypothetical protein M409DRAFT_60344 [Zasmidium cellare ATCC 36951]|uniref:Uncharacterized protein n=1 Tax=Zasmidium cellare ATCC 36951 TaxID=1080233 RepID=A0A6A6C1A8_ZASCE|nr:uncharacterized protein M409DRAFT_60344 [Zasmidium cellare ATCC 36951]KAF2159930.1 hypothetical protein M409DRAFT_60344 [Zasmidium cellare ATCC 36951]